MKKNIKNIIISVFAAALIVTIPFNTYASENIISVGLSTTPPRIENLSEISPYSLDKPATSNVYPNNTQETIAGKTNGVSLYSNNCFYGVKSITGNIKNETSSKLTVTLYYYTNIVPIKVGSREISAGSVGGFSFDNLSPNNYYYLKFDGVTLDFHGFVGGKTN